MTLLYTQKIGCEIPSPTLLRGSGSAPSLRGEVKKAVTCLLADLEDGRLPALDISSLRHEAADLQEICAQFAKKFQDVIVLGTGGSSLGGKTLCDLVQRPFQVPPRSGSPSDVCLASSSENQDTFRQNTREEKPASILFMDNIDPVTMNDLLASLDFSRTGFVVISKSGTTAETLGQFLIVLDHARRYLTESQVADHFMVVSHSSSSPLTTLAALYRLPFVAHPAQIGGRFSIFSVVGTLPALMAGVRMDLVHDGALEVLQHFKASQESSLPAQGAAFMVTREQEKNSIHVLMPYCDRLMAFTAWHRQLWAESLGKEGKGTTPVTALGTVDQHSQLQLYLGGPAQDKFFTFLFLNQKEKGPAFAADLLTHPDLAFLKGQRLGDLMQAEQEATLKSLQNHHQPTRVLHLEALNEKTLGALCMHFMLETLISASLMGINALDQPAVEESKILTRQILQERGKTGGSTRRT